MGAEEYAKRKYNEYERNLKEEKIKADQIKKVQINYDSKNFENEQKVRDLIRELETEKQLKEKALQNAEKKTREI